MADPCEYFTADPDLGDGGVSSDLHDAVDALYFFVPVGNGDAVRVNVCQEHADALAASTLAALPATSLSLDAVVPGLPTDSGAGQIGGGHGGVGEGTGGQIGDGGDGGDSPPVLTEGVPFIDPATVDNSPPPAGTDPFVTSKTQPAQGGAIDAGEVGEAP